MNDSSLVYPLIDQTNVEYGNPEKTGISVDEKQGYSWESSMVIVLANIMGIGVLGLAHAFAHLGWLLGIFALVLALSGSIYAGLLLSRMKDAIPHALVYSDLGFRAYGNQGRTIVNIFGYTYIAGLCLSFHVCAAITFKQMAGEFCLAFSSIIVAAIVFPLSQYRSFHDLKFFVYLGVLSIVLPIVIILVEIWLYGKLEDVRPIAVLESGFTSSTVACMDIVFAVTGQVIFIEIMAGMKNPKDFPKAIYGSGTIFFIIYISLAVTGYFYIGSSVANPMIENLTDTFSRRWCAGFVCIHIIIAYVMEIIVLTQAFQQFVATPESKVVQYVGESSIWFLVTIVIVTSCFVVSNIMPFISDLLGFVGSVCGISTTYVFPYLFAPVILKMSLWEARFCRGIAILSVFIGIVGAYSSIDSMITNFKGSTPFGC